MGLVIDTCIFINAERNHGKQYDFSGLSNEGGAYLAAITVSELLVGIQLAPDESTRIKRSVFVETIIAAIPLIAFGIQEARVYAELCAYFLKPKSLKKTVGTHDLLIAATALANDHTVLTVNKKDFKKIPGLCVDGV